MTRKQQLTLRVVSGGVCLLITSFFVAFSVLALRAENGWASMGAQIGTLLFVGLLGAIGLSLQLWYDERTIVEFNCSERELEFRRLGKARSETKPLSEVASVDQWRGHLGPVGFQLSFLGGSQAYVRYTVPNAAVLAQWLRDHRDGV